MEVENLFKKLTKTILNKELVGVNQYSEFLNRYNESIEKRNSILSGTQVFSSEKYSKSANFIDQKEMGKIKIEPMKAYEYRDIDGIINAVKERFHYTGNKFFGNCSDLVDSESCGDSSHINNSHQIFNSQNIANSYMVSKSKFLLGCSFSTLTNFSINTVLGFQSSRCFESLIVNNTNDSYYSFNCKNCLEVMFSFNQYSKKYCIGNTQLPKDKYYELKEKLILELVEKFEKEKKLPPLIEMANGGYENE